MPGIVIVERGSWCYENEDGLQAGQSQPGTCITFVTGNIRAGQTNFLDSRQRQSIKAALWHAKKCYAHDVKTPRRKNHPLFAIKQGQVVATIVAGAQLW